MKQGYGSELPAGGLEAREGPQTTVLVAVESARVREALVAMLGTLDGFRVVAEADTDEAALEAARQQRPCLALIEPEMSGCRGWWVIQQMQAERVVGVVVALGQKGNCDALAEVAGAKSYIQIGTSPRDLLTALQAATAYLSRTAQAEEDLLPDSDSILDKPTLVDF